MWTGIAAINLAIAVMLGAFAAHVLSGQLSPEQLAWWHTATDYLFYHALGLLLLSVLLRIATQAQRHLTLSLYSMQLGIILFSGSLYGMSLGLPRAIAILTPVGGTLLIIAWLMLAYYAFKTRGKLV